MTYPVKILGVGADVADRLTAGRHPHHHVA